MHTNAVIYLRNQDIKLFEDFKLKHGRNTSKRIMLLIKQDMEK